jgi:hypothetical protein
VSHTDLPANDFSELFRLLQDDPKSYLQREPHVLAAPAIGGPHYDEKVGRSRCSASRRAPVATTSSALCTLANHVAEGHPEVGLSWSSVGGR